MKCAPEIEIWKFSNLGVGKNGGKFVFGGEGWGENLFGEYVKKRCFIKRGLKSTIFEDYLQGNTQYQVFGAYLHSN